MHRSEFRKVLLTVCKVVETLLPAKCRRQIFASLLVVLLLIANSQAQGQAPAQVQPQGGGGDWNVVKSLIPGTRISVKTRHRYRCLVEDVTDDEIVCGAHSPFKSIRLAIRRSEIHEIRISPHPNQTKDMWIGGGIGASAGAIAAGTRGGNYPVVDVFFGGLAGVLPGVIVGGMVPVFQVIFQHGKIIYKR